MNKLKVEQKPNGAIHIKQNGKMIVSVQLHANAVNILADESLSVASSENTGHQIEVGDIKSLIELRDAVKVLSSIGGV